MFSALLASIALSFSGLTLDQAESDGVVASPDVSIAMAKLEEANRQYGAARSGLGPSLTSAYSAVPQGNPPDGQLEQQLYAAGLVLTLEDVLSQPTRVRDASRALAGARADVIAAAREERVKVQGLYYEALKARSIWNARRETLDLAGHIRDASAKRLSGGRGRGIELARATVAVSEAQAAETEARANYDNAIAALQTETGGIALEAFAQTLAGNPPPIEPLLLDPLHASVAALHHRSEVASAEAALDSAKAEAKLSRYDAAPSVTIGAGFTGGIDAGVPIGGPAASLVLSYPLNGRAANLIGAQDAKVDEATARLAGAERSVVLSVAQASRSLAGMRDTAESNTRAREEAQEVLASARRGYDRGFTTSLELITARETYTRALVNEITSIYDLLKAQQALTLEIGS